MVDQMTKELLITFSTEGKVMKEIIENFSMKSLHQVFARKDLIDYAIVVNKSGKYTVEVYTQKQRVIVLKKGKTFDNKQELLKQVNIWVKKICSHIRK